MSRRRSGARDAAQGIYDLAVRLHAPVSLRELGMQEEGIARAAKLATESPYRNPRPWNMMGLSNCFDNAWRGVRPA